MCLSPQGMLDSQLEHLTRVLKRNRIWAVNVGENFRVTREAWTAFCDALPETQARFQPKASSQASSVENVQTPRYVRREARTEFWNALLGSLVRGCLFADVT
jgi:hypothetical protein